jgi:hypothetical protein
MCNCRGTLRRGGHAWYPIQHHGCHSPHRCHPPRRRTGESRPFFVAFLWNSSLTIFQIPAHPHLPTSHLRFRSPCQPWTPGARLHDGDPVPRDRCTFNFELHRPHRRVGISRFECVLTTLLPLAARRYLLYPQQEAWTRLLRGAEARNPHVVSLYSVFDPIRRFLSVQY